MANSRHLFRFDLFQQLVIWLSISMYTSRKGRRYLEMNPELLADEADRELERLISAHVEEKVEMKEQMQRHQALLRNARQRGGSSMAIREAYVNIYGGFTLDLPTWLEEVEKNRMALVRLQRPDRTMKAHLRLLYDALYKATQEPYLASEILAELYNELGRMLMQGPLPSSHASYVQTLEEVIACHEAALETYTLKRYPFQYAKTHMHLGAVFHRYGFVTGRSEAIEHALACYKACMQVYNRRDCPEQWAMLQTLQGAAYTQRSVGSFSDNIEYAITCHEAALKALEHHSADSVWARAQIHLGEAYQKRRVGVRLANLERARACFRAALQIYTARHFPGEWATTHIKLAAVFQQISLEDDEQRDKALCCAIVCCEEALLAYSLDSYPVEYASTQVILGTMHHQRLSEDRHLHLEEAMRCYRAALPVFNSTTYPAEYQQAMLALADAEAEYADASIQCQPEVHLPIHV